MEEPVLIQSSVKILALGDSYTRGESVVFAKNFPSQLADTLQEDGRSVTTRIIAQTGWRTDQLQTAMTDAHIGDSTYDLVTLCIGVNNQYQHGSLSTFKTQFEQLLQTAVARSGQRKERVVVVSIPDWAYTPYGQQFSSTPNQISQKIDQFNEASRVIAGQYGIQYVNVTDISRQGLAQPNLVADDGLHPSAIQYTEWVKRLLPVVHEALTE